MNEIGQQISDYIQGHEVQLMTWSMPAILFVLVIMLCLPLFRKWRDELNLLRKIRKLGQASLHNVIIPDGIGGTVFLEHVVLHPIGIIVIQVRRYRGAVFAADKIDTWTQVLGKRSYKFPNPLRELEATLLAVRNLTPDVTLEGRLLVTREAIFPKGRPDSIINFSEAKQQWGITRNGPVTAALKTAWENLRNHAQPLDRLLQQEVLEPEQGARNNLVLASLLTLFAIAWLMWRLG
ncbi:MAG: NERD domain-containing protein [Proteobacteria bacterium]|jgi:hypothetical protein|nr:NERD domain-containing protein [Pseudomonadota bacterium]